MNLIEEEKVPFDEFYKYVNELSLEDAKDIYDTV